MLISKLTEKEIVNAFTEGASELVGVSLIIGLARGVNLVLEQGMISDTILAYASDLAAGVPGSVFILAQFLRFNRSFFIWFSGACYANYGATCRYCWYPKTYRCISL